MIFSEFLFYLFSVLTLGSAVLVISARNPVHSVFFLIFAFFNAAALFVLIGAEYIAMTLVIVYVGAVAVLFLFVVMMLNVNYAELRQGFMRYLPVGIGVALVLLVEMVLLFSRSFMEKPIVASPASPSPNPEDISNAHSIGLLLYTDYVYVFQICGLILLVAMVGAIVLTLRHREGVRRQNIARQNARTRAESVVVVEVKSGEGV